MSRKKDSELLKYLAGAKPHGNRQPQRSTLEADISEESLSHGETDGSGTANDAGISGTVWLKPRDVQTNLDDASNHEAFSEPESKAWTELKTVGPDTVTSTDLLTIRGLDYLDAKGAIDKITIASSGGPTTANSTGPASLALKWLDTYKPVHWFPKICKLSQRQFSKRWEGGLPQAPIEVPMWNLGPYFAM
ncbi:uncharacterized protein CTRU02_209917 [Colletotrichum truncatum]|uniref:Uncharacterized protein n=1 Tax=Colletotrichum truncatum TaxID=5467 RepID=A0ACC3YTQ7_COLTU